MPIVNRGDPHVHLETGGLLGTAMPSKPCDRFQKEESMQKISHRPILRRVTQAFLVLGLALGLTLSVSGAANAAYWSGISGEVYSDSTKWYVGATKWTKDGTGNVTARFTSVPESSNLHVAVKKVGGSSWSATKSFSFNNVSQKLYSYSNGTEFQVRYKRSYTCSPTPCFYHGFVGELYK